MQLKLWMAAAFCLFCLALVATGYAWGDKHASSTCADDKTQAQQAAQATADETSARREEVAQSREVSREQIRIVYRTIREKADGYREKDRTGLYGDGVAVPVAGCVLDADRLRLWNAANSGAAPLFGKLDYRLPSAATGQVGEAAGSAGQPHRGDGAVQPVPGPAEETGGVRK